MARRTPPWKVAASAHRIPIHVVASANQSSAVSEYTISKCVPEGVTSMKPGETKRWTYTYDLFGPGEKKT